MCTTLSNAQNSDKNLDKNLLSLSEKLLYGVKTETPVDSFQLALAKYSVADLAIGLTIL